MSVGPLVEKFNMVSNDHGRMHKCDFSVFDRKFPFWANLVKKIQNCQFKLKFDTQPNSNMQNSVVVFTFLFQAGNILFGQIWSKNLTCQFKLKFGTQTNSNMQNSMVVFTFYVLDQKHTFRANLVQKIKTVSLS